MQQQKMMSEHVREDLRIKIGEALLALRKNEPGAEAPGLWVYTRYERPSQIPDHELPVVTGRLQAEVNMRHQLGDEQYFAITTPVGKETMYLHALAALRRQLEAEGRRMDAGMTHAEWRVLLNRAIATVALPMVPADLTGAFAPKPKRKPAKKKAAKPPAFEPPSEEEVAAYCKEAGLNMNPKEFWLYYTQNAWVLANGKKMQNWKICAQNWAIKQARFDKQFEVRTGNVRVMGPVREEENWCGSGDYVPMKKRSV